MGRSGYRGGTSLVGPVLVTAFGIGMLAMLVFVSVQFRDDLRIQHGGRAIATVETERIDRRTDKDGTTYDTYVHVHFPSESGQRIRATIHVTGRHAYAEGERLQIRYELARPTNAELAGHPAVGWTGEIVALLGFLAAIALTAYVWRARSRAVSLAKSQP
jgi:hypothetical protein